MVSRVPTFSTNTNLINTTVKSQATLDQLSYQVTTGYKGSTYDVYNGSVNRLLSFENQVSVTAKYIETNTVVSTRQELAMNSVEQITADIQNFKSLLIDFASQDLTNLNPDYTAIPPDLLSAEDQSEIDNLQQSAFNLMKSIETYLNVQADNGYIFSGGEKDTAPVEIPWETLEEFQAIFDGDFTTYPDSRASNLSNYDIFDSITGGLILSSEEIVVDDTTITGNIEITNDGYMEGGPTTTGDIVFSGNKITTDVVGAFDVYLEGDTFEITGTGAPPAGNDGLYTVVSVEDNGASVVVSKSVNSQTITDGLVAGNPIEIEMQTTVDNRYILSHISAENLGAFSELKQGAVFTIEGTAENNGTYYISDISSDGREITILGTERLDPEDIAAGTLGVSFSQDPNIGYIDAINAVGEVIATVTGGPGLTGDLTFDAATGTVTAGINGTFGYVEPGQTITITGTGANDGVHYVKDVSADGTTITLEAPLTDEVVVNGTGTTIDLHAAQHGFVADNVLCSQNTSGTIYFDEVKNEMVATLTGAFSTIKAGDTIVVNGTENNNGVKQVKYVSDDGKTVVFEDSTPVVAEAPVTNGTGVNLGLTYPIGTTIDMSEIDPRYDGFYTITGVADGGNRLIVSTDDFPPAGAPETFVATGDQSISSSSYYQGDLLVERHQVDETTTIISGLNAENAAFEKAIRALGMICSGNLVDTRNPMDADQTTYGVDPNRAETIIEEALTLLEDALEHNPNNITEDSGDLQYAAYSLTMNITTLTTSIENQTATNVFYQNNIDAIEKVNQTEAAAAFQVAYNNLEVSMSALSQMLNLSLLNYLR